MTQETPGRDGTKLLNGMDPTANVRLLLEAAVNRLDDLRIAEAVRVDTLLDAEFRRFNEQLTLRAEFAKELQVAEAKRIDAIRAVDVNAVSVAAERQSAQATVLANQVAASAEALRALVAATATTQAQQLSQMTEAINGRIAALERSSYEGTGKARVADPAIERLALQVEKMSAAQNTAAGSSGGMRELWGWVLGAAALVGMVLSFVLS